MVNISIEYTGDLHCDATHGPSKTELATDAPADNKGKGESFSPTDLVATALASCVLTTMGIVARRHQWPLDGARARVEKHMTATPSRRIARLPVRIEMPAGLNAEARTVLERTARTCPVHESVRADIERPMTFVYPD
jgi:putative redox protein